MKYFNPRVVAVCVQTLTFVIALSTIALAEDVPSGVTQLLDDAPVVVVGTADRTESLWKENSRGDRVIVSRTLIRTREGLKGEVGSSIWLDVEGGTVDGVTLRVSGAPSFKSGDNAVLFLKRNADGTYSLQESGRGVLKLNDVDVVRGTTLALDDIRQAAISRARGGR